jgi:hypothetical protein
MLRRACVSVVFFVLMPATVHAFDHHHDSSHHSSGGGGGGCGSSHESESSTHASSSSSSSSGSLPSASDHKRVFVTSTTYAGALGSVRAADAQCQSAATAAGLKGVFRAWLSDSTSNAYDRITDVGPWYTTGDAVAFAAKSDLRGVPAAELLDESAGYPDPAAIGAWSGSNSDGVATSNDCDGWTNAGGDIHATIGTALTDKTWGGGSVLLACNAKAPLICFQQ